MPNRSDVEDRKPLLFENGGVPAAEHPNNHSQDHLVGNKGQHRTVPSYEVIVNEGPSSSGGNNSGSTTLKIMSAIFYASASFLITVVNKVVLTSYRFPSFQFLALGQIFTTICVLFFARQLNLVSFPSLGKDTFRKIFPLPLLFVGNIMTGLGGTKILSLPMFTALRRFSILMTMLAELYILGVRPSLSVQASVYTMVGGAIIAASNDLAFNVEGYTLVALNNVFTAANAVYIKKKLDANDFGKYGLMYYNALFMAAPAFLLAYFEADIHKGLAYEHWGDITFLTSFLTSCFMGFILNASVVLCTQYNSALTTTSIGPIKNISITYLGMFIGGDYVFYWVNFIGINISVVGSILYTYVTFKRPNIGNKKGQEEILLPNQIVNEGS